MQILVLNCAHVASQDDIVRAGGQTNDAFFRTALLRHDERVRTFTLNTADGERLPQGMGLDDFDGAVISGSPLSVYEDRAEVRDQLGLAREVFERGIPTFGSCYGLQLMTQALGGRVRLNPKGREIGVARGIMLTDAGREHPMYRAKPAAFDALCSHQDEVEALPEGATLLASNHVSDVQAAVIERGASSFWGVQYHPEFDFAMIAAIIAKQAQRHIDEGLARSEAEVSEIARDLRAVEGVESRADLQWRMGLKADVIDPKTRSAEFGAWLDHKVRPKALARA
ncbi:MAG: type 1 glutamine amidotransferase [Hyphomicrobiaceae bacterium]|nr:type 1 glutamine amidotransferase [Hyphomicrobiaceae bacterium]